MGGEEALFFTDFTEILGTWHRHVFLWSLGLKVVRGAADTTPVQRGLTFLPQNGTFLTNMYGSAGHCSAMGICLPLSSAAQQGES